MEEEKQAFDDLRFVDTKAADTLLSQEMMNLSMNDRNDIQEEIHGVKCLAIEESPEYLEAALRDLAYTIDELTPNYEKQAYLQSQQPPQNGPNRDYRSYPTYVNEADFRLRFLRCELFDIRKAAQRMLKFLDIAKELFGEYALRRPIRLSDFSKEELRYMKKGRYQVLPNRDRSGRRVFVMFPEHGDTECPPLIKAKIVFYQSWAIGYNDVESQRKGHVLVVWYGAKTSRAMVSKKQAYPFDQLKSTRLSALHICSPDTPYFQIRRSIAIMRAGAENRAILRIHLGKILQLQYGLMGYGIPTEDIPISWSGKIKTKNLGHWMSVRYAIEQYDATLHSYYNGSQEQKSSIDVPSSGIVECPQPIDILFRKGNGYLGQRGNGQLRDIIELQSYGEFIKRPKQLAHEIYNARQLQLLASVFENDGNASQTIGRYLSWDSENNWWFEMKDKEQICQKMEYIIREQRKSNSNKKGQKRGNTVANTKTIKLSSATKLFQSQDGPISNDLCGISYKKKQRLESGYYVSSSDEEYP